MDQMNPYSIGLGALLGGLQGQRKDKQASLQNQYNALAAFYGLGGAAPVQTEGVLGSMFAGGLSGAAMGQNLSKFQNEEQGQSLWNAYLRSKMQQPTIERA